MTKGAGSWGRAYLEASADLIDFPPHKCGVSTHLAVGNLLLVNAHGCARPGAMSLLVKVWFWLDASFHSQMNSNQRSPAP